MATYRSKAKPKNYDRHIIMSKGHRYVEMSESDDGNPSTPRYRGNRDYRHQNNEMEFEGGLKKVVQPKKKTQPKQKTQPLHNTRSHDAVVPPQNGRRSGGGGPQSANVVPTAPQPSSRGVKKKRVSKAAEKKSDPPKVKQKRTKTTGKPVSETPQRDSQPSTPKKQTTKTQSTQEKKSQKEPKEPKISKGSISKLAHKALKKKSGIRNLDLQKCANLFLKKIIEDTLKLVNETNRRTITIELLNVALEKNKVHCKDVPSEDLVIPTSIIKKMVIKIIQQMRGGAFRLQKSVIPRIRVALHTYLTCKLQDSYKIVEHSKRKAISQKDFEFSMTIPHPAVK